MTRKARPFDRLGAFIGLYGEQPIKTQESMEEAKYEMRQAMMTTEGRRNENPLTWIGPERHRPVQQGKDG